MNIQRNETCVRQEGITVKYDPEAPPQQRYGTRYRVGVRLVGSVLNRRRSYIPAFLEELL